MRKSQLIIAICAGAVVLSSCSGGRTWPHPEDCYVNPGNRTIDECILCKVIEGFSCSVEDATDSVKTLADAELLAQEMDKLKHVINLAKELELDVPRRVTKAYNKALACIQEHDYFNSDSLRAELSTAHPL